MTSCLPICGGRRGVVRVPSEGHLLFDVSPCLNVAFYEGARHAVTDVDEASNWTAEMRELLGRADGADGTAAAQLQTAVRRGVPDRLKRKVFLLSNGALAFLRDNPTFYDQILHQTFGSKVPKVVHGRVPTFSAGFHGVEEELFARSIGGGDDSFSASSASLLSVPEQLSPMSEPARRNERQDSRSSPVVDTDSECGDTVQYRNYRQAVDRTDFARYMSSTASLPLINVPASAQNSSTHLSVAGVPQRNLSSPDEPPDSSIKEHTARGVSFGRRDELFSLESVTPLTALLNPVGLNACKRVLWCINNTFDQLEFCSVLPHALCVLLAFVSETEAFIVCYALIRTAIERSKAEHARPMLPCKKSEFVRYVKVVTAVIWKQLPTLARHLTNIGVDLPAWTARCLQDGLGKLLPLQYLLRVYPAFFFEGAKVFMRYILATLKINFHGIIPCRTPQEFEALLKRVFKERADDFRYLNNLTKLAFQFQIKSKHQHINKFDSRDVPTPYLSSVHAPRLYRPRLAEHGGFLTDPEWEYLWSWLPHNCRILDPHLSFRSDKDGMSIAAIFKTLWKSPAAPIIYALLLDTGEVIGGYSPFAFRTDARTLTRGKEGDRSASFVFKLRPLKVAYWWTGIGKEFMDCSFEKIVIGGEDAAIVIDSGLLEGRSAACRSFGSPSLVDDVCGTFTVGLMEIWILK